MKKIISSLVVFSIVFSVISCTKGDDTTPPQISFNKSAGYVYKDDTLAKGSVLKVGVIAWKGSGGLTLSKITETVTFDNTFDSTLSTTTVTSNTASDSFSHDYTINTRNVQGTERYVFTVYDSKGNTNSVKLNVLTK